MEKYVTSVKDLVIETLSSISIIKTSADRGDAKQCFQMGMIHLLGIKTPINFKKASSYLGNQSLNDDRNATLLLGFVAECEGDYSSAFHYYANTESSEKDTYLDKVLKGRNHLVDYLRKLDLPIVLNKEISSVLNEYSKTKISRREASVKLAAICEDEQTCLEAAKNLLDSKDYISAIQLLNKGKISVENTLYIAINDMFEKSKDDLLKSKVIKVIDLKRTSLLSNENQTSILDNLKKSCDDASRKCTNEWKDKASSYVGAIIKNHKDKEHKAYLDALAEEEARKKKRNKIIKYVIITFGILFFLVIIIPSSGSDPNNPNTNSRQDIEEPINDNPTASQKQVGKSKNEDSSKEEDTAKASNDTNSNNNSFHDFNSSTTMFHHLVGFFADRGGSYPVEIDFSNTGNDVSDVIYYNVKVGVKIPLTCSEFNGNKICFKGKDGNNDFVISLENLNNNSFEGTAVVGNKEFLVELEAKCSHGY